MHHERYINSLIINDFREFYEELLRLKDKALNGQIDPIEKRAIEKDHPENSEASLGPSSLPQKILKKLAELLKTQYTLLETQQGGYAARYYQEAQYAMVALADEVFINLNWMGKKEWEDNLLESYLYNTQDAGEKIFNNLEQFIKNRDISSLDIGVVYLLILGLGFQGKYRGDSDKKVLQEYKQTLYKMIMYDSPQLIYEYENLFSEAYQYTLDEREAFKIPSPQPWYNALGMVVGGFLVLSCIIWYAEIKDVRNLVAQLNSWIKL